MKRGIMLTKNFILYPRTSVKVINEHTTASNNKFFNNDDFHCQTSFFKIIKVLYKIFTSLLSRKNVQDMKRHFFLSKKDGFQPTIAMMNERSNGLSKLLASEIPLCKLSSSLKLNLIGYSRVSYSWLFIG